MFTFDSAASKEILNYMLNMEAKIVGFHVTTFIAALVFCFGVNMNCRISYLFLHDLFTYLTSIGAAGDA